MENSAIGLIVLGVMFLAILAFILFRQKYEALFEENVDKDYGWNENYIQKKQPRDSKGRFIKK